MGIFSLFRKQSLKNTDKTSVKTILQQMNEPRPLPMGMTEFHEWSDRIISGALIPTDNKESLKAVLSSMLMALGPTEDHKPDSYFIHMLRKAATNEVARSYFWEQKNKKETEEKEKAVESQKTLNSDNATSRNG